MLVRSTVSTRSLQKMNDINFCAIICPTELTSYDGEFRAELSEGQQEELATLLRRYQTMFTTPSELPPCWT